MNTLLSVRNVTKSFGGVHAVDDVSFTIGQGEFVGLIGPNGSGKTTLFDGISGVLRFNSGVVELDGVPVTKERPDRIARRGLTRTFQLTHVFAEMDLVENVMLAQQQHQEDEPLRRILHTRQIGRFEREARDRAHELLETVGLTQKAHDRAGLLSYGQRKLLSVAMALASSPKLICLDEPASGITQAYVERVAEVVSAVHKAGTSVLLVEHNLELVMQLSERIIVLAQGKIVASGEPAIVREDPTVIKAYLGG